jgi:hypothetical protein
VGYHKGVPQLNSTNQQPTDKTNAPPPQSPQGGGCHKGIHPSPNQPTGRTCNIRTHTTDHTNIQSSMPTTASCLAKPIFTIISSLFPSTIVFFPKPRTHFTTGFIPVRIHPPQHPFQGWGATRGFNHPQSTNRPNPPYQSSPRRHANTSSSTPTIRSHLATGFLPTQSIRPTIQATTSPPSPPGGGCPKVVPSPTSATTRTNTTMPYPITIPSSKPTSTEGRRSITPRRSSIPAAFYPTGRT